ncbi:MULTISPECIES: hypothetical protein [unclassified Spirosoma]|uniref:hypothetical protein n=1 Tax=unclassified Spirosoma TaxID=2621999 RepID=UPI000B2F707B|nr:MULTISPECIES: hypothetical protein [unclassified Spirosoma]MBN8821906.1 hypothetical protein [Spirosoma sp.]
MIRPLTTYLLVLFNLLLLCACHRQAARVQPSRMFVGLPITVAPSTASASNGSLSLDNKATEGSPLPAEIVANNTHLPTTTRTLTKRVLRMQKLLLTSKRQAPAVSSIGAEHVSYLEQSSSHRQRPAFNPNGLGLTGLGKLMMLGGLVMIILGFKANSGFFMIVGLLTLCAGGLLNVIGFVTGR